MQDLTTEISGMLLEQNASLVGVADLGDDNLSPVSTLPKAVIFGIALNPEIVASLRDSPSAAYVGEYTGVNGLLASLGARVAAALEDAGYRSFCVAPTTGDFDKETLSAVFPHKTAATRAGLGWVGKCALLVTREYGSAIRFATVLTDAPLIPGTPVTRSFCGECTECRTVCPADAPSGREWYPGLARDDFWDARACYAEAQRVADAMGFAHPVCGRCIAACPWTQRYLQRAGKY
ncbi:epoxyqueuosine reductase [Methanogenium sp. S4BF]|uniref:epoxyqueuosine reductase n=1 Tax=Methanogenium sp. S4BF TaxID=1789226 RepID=UPI0024180373|nr:epoxyqueuosine reductase [Methanogenium sp. S4BF]WFN34546.1 epoxyqueuosine reductase [Methanogenium sp. S4BF]